MKKKHEIMLDVAKIAGTRYLIRALLLIKSVVVMRLLAPAGQGLVAQITLVQTYGAWSDLGLNGALTRGLPVLGDSPEERTKRQAMIDTCLTSQAILTALVVAGVAIAGVMSGDPTTRACLLLSAGVVLFQVVFRFFENLLRIKQEFGVIARAFAILELSGLVMTLLFTWLFGAPGFFLALLAAHVVISVVVGNRYRRSGQRLGLRWDPRLTVRMVAAGFPLAGTTILHTLFLSLDRLTMGWLLPAERLGQYTLALLVAGVIQFIPDSVGYILFPHYRQRSAQIQEDPIQMRRYLQEPTEIIAWVIPFFIAGAMLLLPAIPLVLPAYRPGLEPARVLTLFTFFIAINTVALSNLVAFKEHWRQLLVLQAALNAVTLVVLVATMARGYDVTGVAWAMGACYLAYGLSSQSLALRLCGLSAREIAADLARICLPFLYLVPALRGIEWAVNRAGLAGLPAVGLGLALFVPVSLPLLWGVARRTPVLELAGRVLKRARGAA